MCGLCLPHCPSYRVARMEGESPRGRIAYAKALATGAMAATPVLRSHLDDCLACGVCETVCPSHVQYRRIVVATRVLIEAPRAESPWRRRLRGLARRPRLWRALQGLTRPVAALGLDRAMARLAPRMRPALEQLRALPAAATRPPAFSPARSARRGALALFRGCAAAALDADTHTASVAVLTRLGYDVHAPEGPLCCGALAHHAGDVATAERLERQSAEVLRDLPVDAVIGTASGCQDALSERVLAPRGPATYDILGFLARDAMFAGIKLRPARRRAALLVPCTQRGGDAAALLARVPELDLRLLPSQPRCCGAAGLYFIDHPEIAEPLRRERIAQIEAIAPDEVFTTNIGCRLYLGAGLLAHGLALPVRHPITLIAELLQ